MSILYLCNVGLRDLQLDGKPLSPCRLEGERALQRYAELKDRFSAPIIRPGIEFVLSIYPRIDRMILFVTDQAPEVEERFRQNDTVHAGDILKRLLETGFGDKKMDGKIRETKLKAIREQNPSHYDEMHEFYGRQMATKDLRLAELERCYVAPAGGTPAANTGLILQAVATFGEKCQVISIGEANGQAQPIRIGHQLRTAVKKEVILAHLATRSFAEALPLLEEVEATRLALSLARYAKHRLYFDFDEAKRAIVDAAQLTSGEDRRLCEQLRGDLQGLSQRSLEALTVELYHNARITYEGQQYVEFLGRMFRFQEVTLQLAVKRIYDVLLDDEGSEHVDRLQKLVNGNPGLRAYISSAKERGNPLKTSEINSAVLRHLVWYAIKADGGSKPDGTQLLGESERQVYRDLHDILAKMGRLAQLRNHSIIAHGFEGVSKDILMREYNQGSVGATDPVADMARVIELLGLGNLGNPYERICAAIKKEIERL